MTERIIHLDPPPRDWRSRRIRIRAHRWYATVELDREGYADTLTRQGQDPALPALYSEAVDRVQEASTDRIWYEGYLGSFSWMTGPGWVVLQMPFPHVDAAVEALRAAELDDDYSRLHALADRLVLPVDEWLSPGERELIRGVDFDPPPRSFLRFLRVKAKQHGVQLNGRATAGSIWIRPTLSAAQKQLRESSPERYPGWVDRWSGHTQEDGAPLRPWVGGRIQNFSAEANPVEFRTVTPPIDNGCPCGLSLRDAPDSNSSHHEHHAAWALGIRVPKSLTWLSDLAVVTTQSPITWRRLAHQVARLPQRESRYDFPSWTHLKEPEVTPDNTRAYLLQANGHVIGYLTANDISEHRRWDLADKSPFGEEDHTLRPQIGLIWVAATYRRQGIGGTLVRELAADFGCTTADISWSSPVSDAGVRLARRLSPQGIWVS